jgi:lysophospholipase L1-like esterase
MFGVPARGRTWPTGLAYLDRDGATREARVGMRCGRTMKGEDRMRSSYPMLRHLLGPALAPCLLILAGLPGQADDKKPDHAAVKPVPRDDKWVKRHEGFVDIAKKGNVDVVFLGDSITDGWRGKGGATIWKERFDPLKAVNFGIGGDRTQHVLWRIQNGELDGIKPKAAVLMIGTNNMAANSVEEIADGVKAIVQEIQKRQPQTKVLLLGIFPRSPKVSDKVRDKIKEVNKIVAKLDDGKQVHYLDIGAKFLDADGELKKEIMPDFLHLSQKGYEIWADAIKGPLGQLLK